MKHYQLMAILQVTRLGLEVQLQTSKEGRAIGWEPIPLVKAIKSIDEIIMAVEKKHKTEEVEGPIIPQTQPTRSDNKPPPTTELIDKEDPGATRFFVTGLLIVAFIVILAVVAPNLPN